MLKSGCLILPFPAGIREYGSFELRNAELSDCSRDGVPEWHAMKTFRDFESTVFASPAPPFCEGDYDGAMYLNNSNAVIIMSRKAASTGTIRRRGTAND